MRRWVELLAVFAVLVLVCSALAQQQTRVHVVKKGDTLWDLSGYYLENPFLWPDIFEVNKAEIEDPHWIYPGQEFVIPPVYPVAPEVIAPLPEELPPPEEVAPPEEVVEPPPVPEEIVVMPAIPAVEYRVPAVAARLALKGGYLARDEEIIGGYILESEPHKVENLTSSMSLYIDRGAVDGVEVGDRFTVFRVERKVRHPKTGEYLGKIVRVLGTVRTTEVDERTSRAIIDRSFEIIHVKDRIMPYEEEELPVGEVPESTGDMSEGYLVARRDLKNVLKPFDIVYIDQGEIDGALVGDVFEMYRTGKTVRDPDTGDRVQLPENIVGALQVLKVKEKTSTAYIVNIDNRLDIGRGEMIRLRLRLPSGG